MSWKIIKIFNPKIKKLDEKEENKEDKKGDKHHI